ncbi:SurA N-terminal domain-containing protein [Parachlamydia sp. AcF125]|uniref:SurA N-terminal domain-containing protein n=1 Tax=Parachlamydia sp. AcF125 TaxID=2795736 RepID=UPI001BC9418B|nr:SurA N-terminal domain-containing protein [Parachlamydia sp. AcF125]MBS4167926.1 hypothetical protein [Parachlamydia sp. AcF125]
MLHFFRTYERYFYLVITFVIVITFSFFGTYNEIISSPGTDETAFYKVDGSKVGRTDVQNIVHFIATDSEDKLSYGGMWGPNFLNDGVIKKDFLQTGLAEVLIHHYQKDLKDELQKKLEKEKHFSLYTHPQAKFVGVESVWNYLAPDMKTNFDILRFSDKATDSQSLASRVKLFLGQSQLPPALLSNVLRYQERQYDWISPDLNLERMDLSLFGYHTIEDWFGSRFVHLVAQFIVNAATIAEQKGYVVTKEEALADLVQHSEKSFQENQSSPYLGLASSREYFHEQLRRMGMEQTKAVQIWRQVLLFRRLFHDVGSSVFIDPLTIGQIHQFGNESVTGDVYHLPPSLRFADWRSLQKFEVYLEAIAKRRVATKNLLHLPTQLRSVEQVVKLAPELVQKKYTVEIAEVDKKSLQSLFGIKETWNWEVQEANWDKLTVHFPELASPKADTKETRFAVLENLDQKIRARIDAFARSQMIEENPAKLSKALQEVKSKVVTVGLLKKGGFTLIKGLKDSQELMNLLDKAPLKGQAASSPEEGEAEEKLKHFTANGTHYYRIEVLQKAPAETIMTFQEADQQGILDELLTRTLENYYTKIREEREEEFQHEDKTWKDFATVQAKVAETYFQPLLSAINVDYQKNKPKDSSQLIQTLTPELSAPLRFYAYMREARQAIQKTPEQVTEWVNEASSKTDADDLKSQWKLVKEAYKIDRDHEATGIAKEKALKMSEGDWSPVTPLPNGDIHFFTIQTKGVREDSHEFERQMSVAHRLLSDDAQQVLMRKVLKEISDKQAISLAYLTRSYEAGVAEESK